MSKEQFCKAPWVSIAVAASGGIKPCCIFDSSIAHLNFRKGDSLESAWGKWSELRKQFIDGEKPESCNVCWKRGEVLGHSRLEWYNQILDDVDLSTVDFSSTTPTLKPFHMDFNFSNKCNLKCRMCGSWGSTAWFKEETQLHEISMNKPGNPYNRGASRFQLTPNFNDIRALTDHPEYFDNLVRIDFKGGEPLMHEEMFIFLEYLIKQNLSKKIKICYTTNGTKTPKILKELWPHFNRVNLSVSMDGTDGVYEYIRGGNVMTLRELEENLQFFESFDNLRGSFNTTISTYNIFNLGNILDWIDSLKSKQIKRFLTDARNQKFECMVTSPAYLSIENMPSELKKLAREKLNKYPYANIDSIKTALANTEYSQTQWQTFIDFTRDLDKLRDTNVVDVIPELTTYFT